MQRSGSIPGFGPEHLGSAEFRQDHGVKYAYVSGAMYKGIASEELVIRMGRAGLLSYFGSGGLRPDRLESAIRRIREGLPQGQSFGMNLLSNPAQPQEEDATVDLYLRHGVERVDAAAFIQLSSAVVRYRVSGLRALPDGRVEIPHKLMAKVSRPEVAALFLAPPPERLLAQLQGAGRITAEEARLAEAIPMCDDLCVESDSGGHTDRGVAFALLPAMLLLRDEAMAQHRYPRAIRVGAAGGLGTPQAIAAAFAMGADFVMTGSINQCTPEAGTSDLVKDLLAEANVQDTEIAPAGDMFEIGAKVQVLRKGLFFPARANKLYELYRRHESLDEIDAKTREQIEQRYFKRSFAEVYEETRQYYLSRSPTVIERAERSPKHKMALVFRWYFVHSTRLAMRGIEDGKVDFQIQCGPAIGAFNQWVKGTRYQDWRARHVDEIGELLMVEAARFLERQYGRMFGQVGHAAIRNASPLAS
ncbi:PfaD family polyunsaturated fatty acid/polyketide biosynthesis protein [Methylomagnum sp.]